MTSFVLHLDESIPDDARLIVTAGFITSAERLVEIADVWREFKRDRFGIDPALELKYSLSESHPARDPLDESGWTQAARVPAMLETIRDLDVVLIADVVHPVVEELDVRALYLDGFGWCVRRHMNHVGYEAGPHWVVTDYPPRPSDTPAMSERLQELYRFVGTAPFDHYERLYWEPEVLASGGEMPALRHRGFAPGLVAGHARHSELLQIADVIAGCIRDFTHYNLMNAGPNGELPQPTWRDENLAIIAPCFRHAPGGSVRGWGFDVFPDSHPAREALLARLDEMVGA